MKHNLGGNLGGNKGKSPGTLEIPGLSLAEKERFELSLRFTRTTPLAGEPLRPLGYFSIWLDICKNGGERGIRTPGAFQHHWFSRPAPSTTRPSLRTLRLTASSKCLLTIALLKPLVNPQFLRTASSSGAFSAPSLNRLKSRGFLLTAHPIEQ